MAPLLSLLLLGPQGSGAQAIRLKDTAGVARAPLAAKGAKASAVFFLLADCPIARKYSPEIRRIIEDYGKKAVAFSIVHTDATMTAAAARSHAAEFGYAGFPILLDPKRKLVEYAGVTRTPTAAVFSPKGKLLYLGRIDDRFPALGAQRAQPTRHDLRLALDETLAGRPVSRSRTSVVGCLLPRPG